MPPKSATQLISFCCKEVIFDLLSLPHAKTGTQTAQKVDMFLLGFSVSLLLHGSWLLHATNMRPMSQKKLGFGFSSYATCHSQQHNTPKANQIWCKFRMNMSNAGPHTSVGAQG